MFNVGDILLFSGNAFFSNVIKLFTRSHWSHVGIVVRNYENDTLYCLESDESPLCAGETKTGVRLTELHHRIEVYPGEVGVRHLHMQNKEGNLAQYLNVLAKINEFHDSIKGIEYEKHYLDLFRAVYEGPWGKNHGDMSSLFCSELVAACLMNAGILGMGDMFDSADEYTPSDLGKTQSLLTCCYYSDIEIVKAKALVQVQETTPEAA